MLSVTARFRGGGIECGLGLQPGFIAGLQRLLFILAIALFFTSAWAIFFNGLVSTSVDWLVTVPPKMWHKLPFAWFGPHPLLWRALVEVAVGPAIVEELLKYGAVLLVLANFPRALWSRNRWGLGDAVLVIFAFGLIEALLYGVGFGGNVAGQVLSRLLQYMHVGYLALWLVTGLRGRWLALALPLSIFAHFCHNAAILADSYLDFCNRPMSGCLDPSDLRGPILIAYAVGFLPLIAVFILVYNYLRRAPDGA